MEHTAIDETVVCLKITNNQFNVLAYDMEQLSNITIGEGYSEGFEVKVSGQQG